MLIAMLTFVLITMLIVVITLVFIIVPFMSTLLVRGFLMKRNAVRTAEITIGHTDIAPIARR